MRYSEDIDYLVGAIIYLGTSTYWWGRTPQYLAAELNLDHQRLRAVLVGYPGLFRQSRDTQPNGEYPYSLQARYAQFESKNGEEPSSTDDIPPINTDKLKLVIDYVQKMAEHDKTDTRARWTNGLSLTSAILSAITAVIVAAGAFGSKAPKTSQLVMPSANYAVAPSSTALKSMSG